MEQDQHISIRVHNEESDFLRLLWRTRRRTFFVTILLVCLVLGSFSFYASLATPADPSNDRRWIIYVISLVVPLFVAVVMYITLKNYAKKAAASAYPVTMTFDDEGVEIDSPKSKAKSAWSAYEKVLDTPDDFVFYVQSNIFYGVPKRFFDDSKQIEKVTALISENIRE